MSCFDWCICMIPNRVEKRAQSWDTEDRENKERKEEREGETEWKKKKWVKMIDSIRCI